MLPEKTREQFEKVIESQLARIQAMKDQGDFIDYSKLDKIIIGVPPFFRFRSRSARR